MISHSLFADKKYFNPHVHNRLQENNLLCYFFCLLRNLAVLIKPLTSDFELLLASVVCLLGLIDSSALP